MKTQKKKKTFPSSFSWHCCWILKLMRKWAEEVLAKMKCSLIRWAHFAVQPSHGAKRHATNVSNDVKLQANIQTRFVSRFFSFFLLCLAPIKLAYRFRCHAMTHFITKILKMIRRWCSSKSPTVHVIYAYIPVCSLSTLSSVRTCENGIAIWLCCSVDYPEEPKKESSMICIDNDKWIQAHPSTKKRAIASMLDENIAANSIIIPY